METHMFSVACDNDLRLPPGLSQCPQTTRLVDGADLLPRRVVAGLMWRPGGLPSLNSRCIRTQKRTLTQGRLGKTSLRRDPLVRPWHSGAPARPAPSRSREERAATPRTAKDDTVRVETAVERAVPTPTASSALRIDHGHEPRQPPSISHSRLPPSPRLPGSTSGVLGPCARPPRLVFAPYLLCLGSGTSFPTLFTLCSLSCPLDIIVSRLRCSCSCFPVSRVRSTSTSLLRAVSSRAGTGRLRLSRRLGCT